MVSAARTPLRPLQLVVALTFPFVVVFVAILTLPLYAGLSADDTVRDGGLAIYGVTFTAVLGTLGSMLFGVLGARGTLPVALALPMGLVPMAAGLLGYLLGMNNVHSVLRAVEVSERAQLLAAGNAEATLNWLAGTVLACGVWMGAAVTLGALGAGVPEGPRRRQLWGATGVCIGLGLFAFAMALELDPNAQLHRAYANAALAPEQRALLMARSAELGAPSPAPRAPPRWRWAWARCWCWASRSRSRGAAGKRRRRSPPRCAPSRPSCSPSTRPAPPSPRACC
jgi:hypothetical protein